MGILTDANSYTEFYRNKFSVVNFLENFNKSTKFISAG